MNESREGLSSLARTGRQLIQYGFVGGAAALVEWISYFSFDTILRWHYMLATVLAFLIATFVNWVVGHYTMFRNAAKGGMAGEIFGVYIVSGIGLLLNLLFMYVFVAKLQISGVPAKIISTGLVFIWNFISRKIFIYR